MEYVTRKSLRLQDYDYSSCGYYFLTICAFEKQCLFSHIHADRNTHIGINKLTKMGEICAEELLALPNRFPGTEIVKYVIMPNHVHFILANHNQDGSTSIPQLMQTYKSLATRKCKEISRIEKVFQKSYYDHIIRGQKDFENIWLYIDGNPSKWNEDFLYTVEV